MDYTAQVGDDYTPVEAGVAFYGDEAKVRWFVDGKKYALRISTDEYERLAMPSTQVFTASEDGSLSGGKTVPVVTLNEGDSID